MGIYIRLTDYKNSELKKKEFFNEKNCYSFPSKDFSKIPGSPIAYWISDKIILTFLKPLLRDIYLPKQGLITGDNDTFIRDWFEVDFTKKSIKWFPHNKGGEFRRWYGNREHFVNWENNGYKIINFVDKNGKQRSRPQNVNYFFQKSISWSLITSGGFSSRYYDESFIFNVAGISFFPEQDLLNYLLGLFNTVVVNYYSKLINPTLNSNVGDLEKVPVIIVKTLINSIDVNVQENLRIAKLDWDSRETSWDFKQNDLILLKSTDGSVKSTLEEYKNHWIEQFFQLHKNEEELNKIFIEIYGLQDELTPDVPLSDITILKEEIFERDEESKTVQFDELVLIKQFISYAVGCMVGRYSLDQEGLVYAGGEFDSGKYKTFSANKDGIIPILSEDRFEDDITSRFKDFVKVVFGEKNYSSNLEYIANILGRKDDETAIECIRRYFLNDFYKDHVKMYKKRPIYWMYSSGKEKGFNAIVYMHRYKKETISILRMDYLHKLQRSYDTDYETAEKQEKLTSDSKLKIQFQKKMIYLKAVLQELKKYDELLRHYADTQLEIDLDDGVVVNYEKFKDLLVKI